MRWDPLRSSGQRPAGGAAIEAEDQDDLVGRIGRVTVPIPEAGPGEVMIPVRGGTEAYAAWADQPIGKHRAVVVVEVRSARSVTVTPFPEADPIVRN